MSDDLPDINVTRGEKALATVLVDLPADRRAVGVLRAARPSSAGTARADDLPSSGAIDATRQRSTGAQPRETRSDTRERPTSRHARSTAPTSTPTHPRPPARARSCAPATGSTRRDATETRRPPTERTVGRRRGTAERGGHGCAPAGRRTTRRAQHHAAAARLGDARSGSRSAVQHAAPAPLELLCRGVAAIIAATLQALVMAGDYLGDEIDLDESGPLVIAVVGMVFTIARARRPGALPGQARAAPAGPPRPVPVLRLSAQRRGSHCEGCGRATIAPCATCEADAPGRHGALRRLRGHLSLRDRLGASISRLRILPVGPLGSSSGNQILRGYL